MTNSIPHTASPTSQSNRLIPAVRRVLALACLIGLGNFAQAQLVLHVDTTANTFYFTGSDTGTTGANVLQQVIWGAINPGGTAGAATDLTSYVNSSPSAPLGSELVIADDSLTIRFNFISSASPTFTGTGSGFTFDYSSWTANQQSYFESLVGSNLTLSVGSGYQSIAIAVPEPSTYAAILGGVGLVGAMIVRRRKLAA